jgi:hypothetical protein
MLYQEIRRKDRNMSEKMELHFIQGEDGGFYVKVAGLIKCLESDVCNAEGMTGKMIATALKETMAIAILKS